MSATWDIFCKVVDNFGDIGVTWRLARQLADEHALTVRLWVDDPSAFVRLCPQADVTANVQRLDGVTVCRWSDPWPAIDTADVVIAAFGCRLPAAYLEALSTRAVPSLLINLEYLSAEPWVEGCHGLWSPQGNGLRMLFFFPGFTAGTGGLLRERTLFAQRQAAQDDASAREAFLARLGIRPAPGARLLSLFAYENPQVGSWLTALADAAQPYHLLVPEGRVLGDVQAWLGASAPAPGQRLVLGSLTLQVLPFLSQADYDRLLWSCDFNAVRGEDSFVRAQWAAQPLLWHIYVQEEQAHLDKLEAFLAQYLQGVPAPVAEAVANLWRAWNLDQDMGQAWRQVLPHWEAWQAHARHWSATQAARPDLAMALVQFYRNWL
ncbi:elongation factor P maturation arginine rhamnosyltransferase EarP [Pseudomonas entomophila]|uniref:elongation factor P maturation arginine rhamnosyltransferase EarP n=1 Tax=Pseudomonas entomophila TaxID=312306 RepID=UPI0015E49608|nr:elongation factor P maturation arginine rhamnosyltransferase EarP [Pseudomonas entomophila]MBA1191193.1 elongation factor P maturation arginine rhamnosyltransferase EarP [Pseudomonas entomophila]